MTNNSPSPSHRDRSRLERTLRRAVARPKLVAAFFFATTLLYAAVVSHLRPVEPRVHDEFSYLLAADTFASGRLANPTHPMWPHFESFHIIQQPAYASKYPPGQGLVLALGQSVFGRPLVGLWLLSAAATAACYWMLLGWTSRRWAFGGGVLCAVHPGLQLAWGQTYWGGTLAFLGGALVFGAAGRLAREPRVGSALAMAIGGSVLAVTRPFEGLLFCVFVGLWLAVTWATRPTVSFGRIIRGAVAPQAIVYALLLMGWAGYNQAVTGDPWTMPYQIHEATYGRAPLFVWQPPRPEQEYERPEFKEFHEEWSMNTYRAQRTLKGTLLTKWQMAKHSAVQYFPGYLAAFLLFLRPWRPGRLGPAMFVLAATWLASLAATWNLPHYVAMLGPLLLMLVLWGIRSVDAICRWWFGWRYAGATLVAVQVLGFAVTTTNFAATPVKGWHYDRARLAEELARSPGQHLVIVRYGPDHSCIREWVYNRADIDAAKVVWACDLGDQKNATLRDYFRDRQIWLVDADQAEPQLQAWNQPGAEDVHLTSSRGLHGAPSQ